MEIRRYSAPLTVLAAGVLGFSIICLVSAAALANPATTTASEIEPIGPKDVVNSAFAKPINTAVAMTVVEMSERLVSPTPSLVYTPSPTVEAFGTATLRAFITWTSLPPTKNRDNGLVATATKVPSTATRPPTLTATRIIPTSTHTDVPSTNTPRPTSTDTPVSPPPDIPTDTPLPPPTDVPTDTAVPPTDTPAPPPTAVPIVDTPTP